MTVNHVLTRIREGSLPSRLEHGFVFVDVAPGSFTYHRPRRPDEPPPATFVAVRREQPVEPSLTEAESIVADCVSVSSGDGEASPVSWTADAATDIEEDPELPPLDAEEDDKPLPPRDAIRAAVARQRRRPLAA